MMDHKITSVDQYIASFSKELQTILKQVRAAVQKKCPDAEESIAYGMPAYKYLGPLVYFAAFKNHIGFYALPSGHLTFEKELSKYKQGKGSVQFPLDQAIPLKLIEKIVAFRVQENIAKNKEKMQNKKTK